MCTQGRAAAMAAPKEHRGGRDARGFRGQGQERTVVVGDYALPRIVARRAVVAASSTVLVAISTTTP